MADAVHHDETTAEWTTEPRGTLSAPNRPTINIGARPSSAARTDDVWSPEHLCGAAGASDPDFSAGSHHADTKARGWRFVFSGRYAAAHALERTCREIRAKGTTDELRDSLMPFDEFNRIVGLEQRYADDERFKV